MIGEKTGYEREEWRGAEVPAPEEWSVNWVEGDVISWYWGDEKTPDGTYAHLFAKYDGGFDPVAHELQFDDDTVEVDHDENYSIVMSRVAKALADHAPTEDNA